MHYNKIMKNNNLPNKKKITFLNKILIKNNNCNTTLQQKNSINHNIYINHHNK